MSDDQLTPEQQAVYELMPLVAAEFDKVSDKFGINTTHAALALVFSKAIAAYVAQLPIPPEEKLEFGVGCSTLIKYAAWMTSTATLKSQDTNFINVESSTLNGVYYNPTAEVLLVRFNSGAIYQYSGVPNDVYTALMNAESKGSAFHKLIKQGDYPYALVRQSSAKPEGL